MSAIRETATSSPAKPQSRSECSEELVADLPTHLPISSPAICTICSERRCLRLARQRRPHLPSPESRSKCSEVMVVHLLVVVATEGVVAMLDHAQLQAEVIVVNLAIAE